LPDGYSCSLIPLTILTWSCQYFFYLAFCDTMVVDVWQAGFWINVVANVPDSQSSHSCKIMAANASFEPHIEGEQGAKQFAL
jgi:hypothetical protein